MKNKNVIKLLMMVGLGVGIILTPSVSYAQNDSIESENTDPLVDAYTKALDFTMSDEFGKLGDKEQNKFDSDLTALYEEGISKTDNVVILGIVQKINDLINWAKEEANNNSNNEYKDKLRKTIDEATKLKQNDLYILADKEIKVAFDKSISNAESIYNNSSIDKIEESINAIKNATNKLNGVNRSELENKIKELEELKNTSKYIYANNPYKTVFDEFIDSGNKLFNRQVNDREQVIKIQQDINTFISKVEEKISILNGKANIEDLEKNYNIANSIVNDSYIDKTDDDEFLKDLVKKAKKFIEEVKAGDNILQNSVDALNLDIKGKIDAINNFRKINDERKVLLNLIKVSDDKQKTYAYYNHNMKNKDMAKLRDDFDYYLKLAKKIYKENKVNYATLYELNFKLNRSINDLSGQPTNIIELEKTIKNCEELKKEDLYNKSSEKSKKAFDKALDKAVEEKNKFLKSDNNKDDSIKQNEVDDVLEELKKAKDNLDYDPCSEVCPICPPSKPEPEQPSNPKQPEKPNPEQPEIEEEPGKKPEKDIDEFEKVPDYVHNDVKTEEKETTNPNKLKETNDNKDDKKLKSTTDKDNTKISKDEGEIVNNKIVIKNYSTPKTGDETSTFIYTAMFSISTIALMKGYKKNKR